MPDLFDLLSRWWKRMATVTMLAVVAAGAWVFFQTPLYLSKATAVPASVYNSDKGKVFNNNIQSLYPSIGGSDELDLVLGTAALDTVYIYVSKTLALPRHYQLQENEAGYLTAALKLKACTRVIKSDYGELQVKVWDRDKNMAPQMANAILDKLQQLHQQIRSAGDENTLQALLRQYSTMMTVNDTLTPGSSYSMEETARYRELIHEYKLLVENKPPVLVTVEKARPAEDPDKPKRIQTIAVVAILAFIFSFLTALLFDRKKAVA